MVERAGSTVLFLCTGNYYRSRTAEALFAHYSAQAGLSYSSTSRGLRLNAANAGPISPHASAWLDARGVPYDPRDPRDLSESDLITAARIVACDESEHRPLMRARFAEWVDRVEYWWVHDIDRTTPVEALADIDRRVTRLVESLRAR